MDLDGTIHNESVFEKAELESIRIENELLKVLTEELKDKNQILKDQLVEKNKILKDLQKE